MVDISVTYDLKIHKLSSLYDIGTVLGAYVYVPPPQKKGKEQIN